MRRRRARAWLGVLLTLLVWLVGASASAHDFRPAVLSLDEVAPGRFVVGWQPSSALAAPGAPDFVPQLPSACRVEEAILDCGPDGLRGTIGVAGIETGYLDVAVRVRWLDGRARTELLDAKRPTLVLGAPELATGVATATYLGLGFEHILSGFDHLLFVTGLCLLVGLRRRLLWTITAFTVGHAISLAASVLELVRVPQGPVEAIIALSVLLVAVELVRERETLLRRWPAALALAFGLVHGMGFAAALREIGLPDEGIASALAAFNVGIELGQLLVVAVCLGVWALVRRHLSPPTWTRLAPAYMIGSVAVAWLLDRVMGFWGAA